MNHPCYPIGVFLPEKIAKSFIAEPEEEESFPGKVSRRHPSPYPSYLEFSSFSLLKNPRERVNRASILKADGHQKKEREIILQEDISFVGERKNIIKHVSIRLPRSCRLLKKRYAFVSGFHVPIRTTPFNSIRDKRHDVHG